MGLKDIYFEKWKKLKYKGIKDMYDISSLGRVRNRKTKKLIAINYSEKGYAMVSLMAKDKKVNEQKNYIV